MLKFIIIHFDAFNHCIETRKSVKNFFTQEKLSPLGVKEFLIPDNNETFEF